jgi:hypothetical protein
MEFSLFDGRESKKKCKKRRRRRKMEERLFLISHFLSFKIEVSLFIFQFRN